MGSNILTIPEQTLRKKIDQGMQAVKGEMDLKKNNVVALGLDFEQNEIMTALASNGGMAAGMAVEFFSLETLKNSHDRLQVFEFIKQNAAVVIIKDIFWEEGLEDFFETLTREIPSVQVIPLGTETIRRGVGNIELESVERINRYFIYGGQQNITHALSYIRAKFLENTGGSDVPGPQPMPFDGIFHPESPDVFISADSYLEWYEAHIASQSENQPVKKMKEAEAFRRIGLLTHRSSWITGNLAVEAAMIKEFENQGICVIPVFNYGSQEPELGTKDFDGIVESYFSRGGTLAIDALINLQIFVLSKDSTARSVFQQVAEKLEVLNIPVFKPLISHSGTLEAWAEGTEGLSMEIPWAFTVPEMQGMIEPVIIGCRDKNGKYAPVAERIVRFVSRAEKWVCLKNKPNHEKKLAIFIHNAPCSGVEATIGLGAGLDVFSSIVKVLGRLNEEGWKIASIPGTGKELRELVMEKKAYSDFRWTSVEDIIDSGGSIYRMPVEGEKGYSYYYEQLDTYCRKQMEDTWGPPPGEGMVFENKLVITGLDFGNVAILVQPKRGCYGAKCTGEVCKILQDPLCPPTHQYLATYRFVENIFNADAVLHVGTHGSLEFLPGKTNAMSGRCYPDAVLGSLPNFYIYNAGVGTEAILAKRRSNAVIIDHLPPAYSGGDADVMQLAGLVGEYIEAFHIKSVQLEVIEKQLRQKIGTVKGAGEVVEREARFYDGITQLKNIIVQSLSKPRNEKLHEFGRSPAAEDAAWYIKEILRSEGELDLKLRGSFDDELDSHRFLMGFIMHFIQPTADSGEGREKGDGADKRRDGKAKEEKNGDGKAREGVGGEEKSGDSKAREEAGGEEKSRDGEAREDKAREKESWAGDAGEKAGSESGGSIAQGLYPSPMDEQLKTFFDRLPEDIKELSGKLERTGEELDRLITALNGGYVPPGPSGMPDENGRNILPTGRNMYLMDIDKIPTKAAYEVGSRAAEELVAKYREDEGKLPEKIAMNMISLDISRSKGEQLSQILYLMGITPVWDKNNKVIGLDVIPASVLKRPRIDVTVRISGVLRDCYPHAVELIDCGVNMAANLQEDETVNYVRKHTLEIARTLSETGAADRLERRATIRVFGDRPGTYGAGVDLALKASAWKDESDLARTFVYFSSYAYGKALKGDHAVQEFIENVKAVDASYDTTNSKRYGILSSNFGASVQGGFGLVKKVLQGGEIRQYHGSGEKQGEIKVQRLEEKLKEAMEETFFNPLWKEQAKKKGYEGASQLMHKLQNIFEWQCLTSKIDDGTIDRLVTEYINDPVMQQWFKENNRFALEETARRFLELQQRGRWKPDPEVFERLKTSYLNIEGDMEERLGEVKGDIQAGGIEIISNDDIKEWKEKLKEVDELFEKH